jgi:hypothetical protein
MTQVTVKYIFNSFYMTFNRITGKTVTYYPDETWTGGNLVDDDTFHANNLGIEPRHHRLAHEIGHHLIGFHYYKNKNGSPILYKAAHNEFISPQDPVVKGEEFLVTGLTYFAMDKECYYRSLWDLSKKGINMQKLKALFKWLVFVPEGIDEIKINL